MFAQSSKQLLNNAFTLKLQVLWEEICAQSRITIHLTHFSEINAKPWGRKSLCPNFQAFFHLFRLFCRNI